MQHFYRKKLVKNLKCLFASVFGMDASDAEYNKLLCEYSKSVECVSLLTEQVETLSKQLRLCDKKIADQNTLIDNYRARLIEKDERIADVEKQFKEFGIRTIRATNKKDYEIQHLTTKIVTLESEIESLR